MNEHTPEVAKDILRGATEIAVFLYGSGKYRRRIYHLKATSTVPFFKIGSVICARKSVLLKWFEAQEQRHANDNHTHAGKA